MSLKPTTISRLVISMTTFILLALTFVPSALAVDPPAITMNPVWRPAAQLSSIDGGMPGVTDMGDDLRYVDAEIYVTTSVQFWAAEITCTVDKTVLETYIRDTDTAGGPLGDGINSPDDAYLVTYGQEWMKNGNNYLSVQYDNVNTNGKINFAASAVHSSLGHNGVKTTFLLATIRYRTKVLTANKTTPLTCTAAFVDKNGKTVLVPTVTAPAPLKVMTGYSVKGNVRYQDQVNSSDIVVDCYDSTNTVHHSVGPVTAIGDFVINTRNLGTHNCYFYGSKISSNPSIPEDAHITGLDSFKLNVPIYNLLPVTLLSGNVDRDGTGTINFGDFNVVTLNWNNPKVIPFTNGDANGDTKVDKSDLALVVGNYYLTNTPYVDASHMIYSLPRDNDKFMNSHVWIGGYKGLDVSQFVAGTERNYWATLSPDGSKIAFTRNIGVGTVDKFALFVAPVLRGVVGTAVNITPKALFDAFAPSWSPDGTMLAFACAYSRADWTNGSGRGNLCFIDGDGKNLRQKFSLPISNQMINIHPVAWFNNNSIMYGGPDWTGNLPIGVSLPSCNNRICIVSLDGFYNAIEVNILPGSDMPTIRSGPMGSVVFYRLAVTATNRQLYFAELDDTAPLPKVLSPGSANCAGGTVNAQHCAILIYGDIGYFNVYTGNNDAGINQYGIMAYNQNTMALNAGGAMFGSGIWNGSPSAPSWTWSATPYNITNAVGNPDITPPYTTVGPNVEGYLALRNTVEWNP